MRPAVPHGKTSATIIRKSQALPRREFGQRNGFWTYLKFVGNEKHNVRVHRGYFRRWHRQVVGSIMQ